jgi:membrane-bound transcription factor site-1 protease
MRRDLFIVLLLIFFLLASCATPSRTLQRIDDEYLIVFHSYYYTREHNQLIQQSIIHGDDDDEEEESCMSIIERDNPSTRLFPSDFALVKFNCTSSTRSTTILNSLRSNTTLVKHVVPHVKMSTKLLEHDEEEEEEDVEEMSLVNKVGRPHTQWSRKLFQSKTNLNNANARSVLVANTAFQASELWKLGITGKGVHIAIFDTGLCPKNYGFKNIEEQINYTNEKTPYDSHGHGTFVASVIAGSCTDGEQCCSSMKGLAPDAHLHIFKVFTRDQVSYTSWFLDAFNYALQKRVNILNLSIGGPDYMDMPFVDKVRELAAHNVILVSAIGNDGPLYGTLNNPADLSYVLGIGAVDHVNMKIAPFSSRGMSLYELSIGGYGRMKPDLVTYGVRVLGHACVSDDNSETKCQKLSGTSVASPVATGVIALLLSASYQMSQPSKTTCFNTLELEREALINPASIKQILTQSAQRVPHHNMFEQGMGKIDLLRAYKLLEQEFKDSYINKEHATTNPEETKEQQEQKQQYDNDWPRVSFHPPSIDFTECTFQWPFCAQPLYYTQIPVVMNVTILNGMSMYGTIVSEPEFIPSDEVSDILDVTFTYSKNLFPWTGHIGVSLGVKQVGRFYSGVVSGKVQITVNGKVPGFDDDRYQTIALPVKVTVIPTPNRSKRILWDQYHQLVYPTASYVPKDDLSDFVEPDMNHNVVDWNGDHPHTNFLEVFNRLIRKGYYIEVLNAGDLTSFDARNYGTLLIIDPEDEFLEEEAVKLENDVKKLGLSVIVFADWYNEFVIRRLKFLDDNTQTIWVPVTGGSNIPALNGLLHRFGIMLGDTIYTGPFSMPSEPEKSSTLLSSTSITRFPKNGELFMSDVSNETPRLLSRDKEEKKQPMKIYNVPILGMYQPPSPPLPATEEENVERGVKSGKIIVFSDSNCIDLVSKLPTTKMCLWLLEDLLAYTNLNKRSLWMDKDLVKLEKQDYIYAFGGEQTTPNGYNKLVPRRLDQSPLYKYSRQPAEEVLATFNISSWPRTAAPFYIQSAPDDIQPTVQVPTRSRIILPVMFVFLLLVLLIYMSFTRHRNHYLLEQTV